MTSRTKRSNERNPKERKMPNETEIQLSEVDHFRLPKMTIQLPLLIFVLQIYFKLDLRDKFCFFQFVSLSSTGFLSSFGNL